MNLTKKHTLLSMVLFITVYFTFGSASEPVLSKKINLDVFRGTWYEIARMPNGFEKDLVEVTSTFEIAKNGRFVVENKGYVGSKRGQKKVVRGEVIVPDKKEPFSMKVRLGIVSFDYNVIDFDYKDENYVVITSNSRNYLWILCKQPAMDPFLYEKLLRNAHELGYRTDKLELVSQSANGAVAEAKP